jgi:hypothetical protein
MARLIYIPTTSSTFVVVYFLIIAIKTGARWNPNIILICTSLVAKDGGHLFFFFSGTGMGIQDLMLLGGYSTT